MLSEVRGPHFVLSGLNLNIVFPPLLKLPRLPMFFFFLIYEFFREFVLWLKGRNKVGLLSVFILVFNKKACNFISKKKKTPKTSFSKNGFSSEDGIRNELV